MNKIIDVAAYRNRYALFEDRMEAGLYLADMLSRSEDTYERSIVMAIPSGGVPIGLQIRQKLGIPMDLLITRKIQIPGNTEAGFGAMTMDGRVFFNEELLARLQLSEEQIEQQTEQVRRELERRNARLRSGKGLPHLDGSHRYGTAAKSGKDHCRRTNRSTGIYSPHRKERR